MVTVGGGTLKGEKVVEGLYTHAGWVYTSILAGLDAAVKDLLRRASGLYVSC